MATDNIVVDLSNYRELSGDRVPPGRYTVVVEDADHTEASTGSVGIQAWMRVEGGEFDGSTLVERFYYRDKDGKPSGALFRLVGFMQAVGLPTPKKKLSLRLDQFIGKRLEVDVDDGDPYNGKVKSEIRGFMRKAGGGAAKPSADLSDLESDASTEDVPESVDLDKLDI